MKEDKEMSNLNVVSNNMSESCRCNELEERSKKVEMRCAELEFKLQKKDEQCEALEAKLRAFEGEVEVLRVFSEGRKQKKVFNVKEGEVDTVIDLTDDNEVDQLMIENSVLECEKKRFESEVEVWKDRYWKLESWASQLKLESGSYYHEENGKEESDAIRTGGSSHLEPIIDSKMLCAERVKRQLTFETGESPGKKMALSTPSVAKSSSVFAIDIVDSDDEPNIAQHHVLHSEGSRNTFVSSCFTAENEKMSSSYVQNNEEDRNSGEDLPFVVTLKRKRNCNVVTSESESDDDDVPNCKFKRMHIQEVRPDKVRCDTNNLVPASTSADYKVIGSVTPRQRIMPLRKLAKKNEGRTAYTSGKAKHQQSNPTNDTNGDDESQEDLSDCEDEDLSDFIVDDFDELSCDDTSGKSQDASNGDVNSDSSNSQDVPDNHMDDARDVSDEDVDFSKIISQIQRRKDDMEWEFEADMLAAFGKDSELCMKAVCALYQQQTLEEQMSKGTFYTNQRGFSKFDAHRGSTLAEYLTHGDPRGGLKKSVKELHEHDPKAVELCRTFAIRYSKQLYQIYINKENPFFP
ncbi:hypothetical protein PHAVU_009G137300 [Phaseolus vulgaris]|uniref:Uncharacterized protein n=1 Tax=Phaseolus vulgaris TaxID=3885 RepID=V7AW93_PHAVU|nr:hypothetical protein PHAVU_009G137300g [Phaseolus vulgaris]ESW09560.1 hypothetical protein PHAVU_009G137300g [Phaseolus vulgaris]